MIGESSGSPLPPSTAAAPAASGPRPRTPWAETGYRAGLLAILLISLWMRTANLAAVQNFNGDQGRDYLVIMNWLQRGQWPLLGPDRAAVGDHALGPGWFYTIAPAIAVSHYHPAAGAATVAAAAVLSIFLVATWLRRVTGSRAAALATAAVIGFSTLWTEQGRSLWNPNMLPLGVAGLAFLISTLPRRPLSSLAGAAALMAILPQWHTTGLLVDAAALGPLALAAWCARPALRAAPRRQWLAWAAVLSIVIGFLYVPPLIYELRPGPGNIISYFTRAVLPSEPFAGSWLVRAWLALDRLVGLTAYQAFLTDPGQLGLAAGIRLAAALGCAMACALLLWQDFRIPHFLHSAFRIPHSALFLALLAAGFWLVLLLKGASVQDYYLVAPQTALVMLFGWVAGRLLSAPPRPGARVHLKNLAGTALLLTAAALCLGQFPRAWAVHQGMTPYRFTFRVTQEVAAAIARDAAGRPFSVELAEPYNFPAHYFYLLRRLGGPPLNGDYYAHAIPRAQMGERIYVIAGPGMDPAPVLKGLAGPLDDSLQVRNVTIYRIVPATLPPKTRELRIRMADTRWGLEAVEE